MTKEQKAEAIELRLRGYTLQRIANQFGVTREYIRQITADSTQKQREKYIFPNITKWLADNKVRNYEFAESVYSTQASVSNWLTGKNEPSLGSIRLILATTGMTFEEAFATKEDLIAGRFGTPVDYVGLSDYAKSWPDKLVSFFSDHCADDEYSRFVRGFWEYCKEADKDGPAIEGWLET